MIRLLVLALVCLQVTPIVLWATDHRQWARDVEFNVLLVLAVGEVALAGRAGHRDHLWLAGLLCLIAFLHVVRFVLLCLAGVDSDEREFQ